MKARTRISRGLRMNKQDGTHYECAGLATRFALGWLARAEENLRSTRRISRSPHHHELEQKAKLLQHDLLDLAVKLFQSARRIGVTGPQPGSRAPSAPVDLNDECL